MNQTVMSHDWWDQQRPDESGDQVSTPCLSCTQINIAALTRDEINTFITKLRAQISHVRSLRLIIRPRRVQQKPNPSFAPWFELYLYQIHSRTCAHSYSLARQKRALQGQTNLALHVHHACVPSDFHCRRFCCHVNAHDHTIKFSPSHLLTRKLHRPTDQDTSRKSNTAYSAYQHSYAEKFSSSIHNSQTNPE